MNQPEVEDPRKILQLTAMRLAHPVPLDRDEEIHIRCIWNNFQDAYDDYEHFRSQLKTSIRRSALRKFL